MAIRVVALARTPLSLIITLSRSIGSQFSLSQSLRSRLKKPSDRSEVRIALGPWADDCAWASRIASGPRTSVEPAISVMRRDTACTPETRVWGTSAMGSGCGSNVGIDPGGVAGAGCPRIRAEAEVPAPGRRGPQCRHPLSGASRRDRGIGPVDRPAAAPQAARGAGARSGRMRSWDLSRWQGSLLGSLDVRMNLNLPNDFDESEPP